MSSFEYWLWIKFAPRPENSRKWIKQWHTVLSRVPLNSFIIHNFWIKWRKCGTRRPVPAPLSTFDAATHIERHQVRRAQVALCRQSIKSWFTYTALDLHTKLSCKLTLIWVYDLNVWINENSGHFRPECNPSAHRMDVRMMADIEHGAWLAVPFK